MRTLPTLPTTAAAGNSIRFSDFEYDGAEPATQPAADQYTNPIIAGFYPDPSLCRAGDDFYLVHSSFALFPGVPIFHSRDLVNWEQIGHVLDRPSQLKLDGLGISEGVYAPAISFHDGTFYLITTLVGGGAGGNFYVTAHDPAGPWSEPNWLTNVDGIDPSFFFDDDGRAYIVHNGPPPTSPRYEGHRAIWMHAFDPQARSTIAGSEKILVNGGTDLSKQPIWIEAPHVFKRSGRYYLICAEGGTGENHSEVVFRSDKVWGPYQPFEKNPILTQRDLRATRAKPVTCAGHADFIQTLAGEWWGVFLACRPYENSFTNIGRETFMLPVRWENDWPIMTLPGQVFPSVAARPKLPPQRAALIPLSGSFTWRDDFSAKKISDRWVQLCTPRDAWFTVGENGLQIRPRAESLDGDGNPSFLATRQQHANFTATASLTIDPHSPNCGAGLVAFQNETHYFFIGVVVNGGRAVETFLESRAGGQPLRLAGAALKDPCDRIALRIRGAGRWYSFDYQLNGGAWITLKENLDGGILSTQVAGGFVGTMLGPFARSAG